jgi:hypothetical protein
VAPEGERDPPGTLDESPRYITGDCTIKHVNYVGGGTLRGGHPHYDTNMKRIAKLRNIIKH